MPLRLGLVKVRNISPQLAAAYQHRLFLFRLDKKEYRDTMIIACIPLVDFIYTAEHIFVECWLSPIMAVLLYCGATCSSDIKAWSACTLKDM